MDLDFNLLNETKKNLIKKEVNMINDYKELYLHRENANQLKVYSILAEKYGYKNHYSVRRKFQTLKEKYGKDLNINNYKNLIRWN